MSEADPAPLRPTLSFAETVRDRRSVRRFLPDPVPAPLLATLFEEAQMAPSNCNTQPWVVHVVSGAARDRMQSALEAAWDAKRISLDFSFDTADFTGVWDERRKEQGACYLDAIGVARGDASERDALTRNNLSFFGAPHVAFLFMPSVGDNVRVASDVGLYAQTLMLACSAHGLGSVPQTMLGFFADTVRAELGVPADLKLLFGISFGTPDLSSPAGTYRIGRAPVDEVVHFHG